jgi:hypothetical protein
MPAVALNRRHKAFVMTWVRRGGSFRMTALLHNQLQETV